MNRSGHQKTVVRDVVLSEKSDTRNRWCSRPGIGCAILSPSRSIGRVQGAPPQAKGASVLIIIAGMLRQKAPKVCFAEYDTWSVHSWRVDRIERSTWRFCQGERKDVGRCVHREPVRIDLVTESLNVSDDGRAAKLRPSLE